MKSFSTMKVSQERRWLAVAPIVSSFLAVSFILLPCRAIGVETDLVFILDRSAGVEQCLFDFQLAAVSKLICGGDCSQQSCSDNHLPHDGSVAVTVLTFGWVGGVEIILNKETLNSTSAQTICSTIRDFDRSPGNSLSVLFAGLQEAKELLEQRDPAPAERVVIILSDIADDSGVHGLDPRVDAEELRTMESTPARISAFRFSDYPTGGFGPLDPDCSESYSEELLAALARCIRGARAISLRLGLWECAEATPPRRRL